MALSLVLDGGLCLHGIDSQLDLQRCDKKAFDFCSFRRTTAASCSKLLHFYMCDKQTTRMADKDAPPSKFSSFFRSLLCVRGSVIVPKHWDPDCPVVKASEPMGTLTQKSALECQSVALIEMYTSQGGGDECPTSSSLVPSCDESQSYLECFTCPLGPSPHSGLNQLDMCLSYEKECPCIVAGEPSFHGESQTSRIDVTPTASRKSSCSSSPITSGWLHPNMLQDQVPGETDFQPMWRNPALQPSRLSLLANGLDDRKSSPSLTGMDADQAARMQSTGTLGRRHSTLPKSSSTNTLALLDRSSSNDHHFFSVYSSVEVSRGSGDQAAGLREPCRMSDPRKYRRRSAAVSGQSESTLPLRGLSPDPAWLRKCTLSPRLQNGRIGRLLELQKQTAATSPKSIQSCQSLRLSSSARHARPLLSFRSYPEKSPNSSWAAVRVGLLKALVEVDYLGSGNTTVESSTAEEVSTSMTDEGSS
eukprot:gene8512-4871_t